jgi:hypothetical protein
VTKYSPHHIIDGEAYWYQNAPELAQQYIPRMLNCRISPDTTCFIELERLAGRPRAD